MAAIHIFELQERGIIWQIVDVDFTGLQSPENLAEMIKTAVKCFKSTKVALFRYFEGLPAFDDEADMDMETLTLRLQVFINLLAAESMAVGVLAPDGFGIIASRSDMLKEGETVEVQL